MKSSEQIKAHAFSLTREKQRLAALGRPPKGLVPPIRMLTADDVNMALHREMAQAATVNLAKPEDFERIRADLKR